MSINEGPAQVNVKINPGKRMIYPQFKELVTEQLGSDVCYVTVELWELFLNAMKSAPNPSETITLKFLRQNVQLNIGCNFSYNVRRARRAPPGPLLPEVKLDRNHILPGLIEMWPTLTPASRAFWTKALQEAGVMPSLPSISTGAPKPTTLTAQKTMDQSIALATFEVQESVGGVGAQAWRKEREEYLAGRGEF